MPFYSYSCKSCSKSFNLLKTYNDRKNATCKECGNKLELKLSTPNVKSNGGNRTTRFT